MLYYLISNTSLFQWKHRMSQDGLNCHPTQMIYAFFGETDLFSLTFSSLLTYLRRFIWLIYIYSITVIGYSSSTHPHKKLQGFVDNKSKLRLCWHIYTFFRPWCNGYRRRKWTRRHEFKSSKRLIAFHIALIPLRKVWIQLFSLQLWVNSRSDWVLQPWRGN